MRDSTRYFSGLALATGLLAAGSAGCGAAASEDVAYEDTYAGDYYYPADVGYAGVYAGGWGYYGIYAVTPTTAVATGAGGAGGSGAAGASGAAGSAASGSGGSGSTGSVATTVRGAVGEAIRDIALGHSVCPGKATVTRPAGSSVCGLAGSGLNVVFNGCQLSGGGTVDGTVTVQFTLTASDTACATSTQISWGYTSTITNLVYTGSGGGKITIPTQMDTATLQLGTNQPPATIAMSSSGEVQRFGADGSMTSDRTFTGTRTFSSISIPNQTYTVDGMINVMDKSSGGTATISASGVQHQQSCCRPTGGMLSVSRTGGSHSGSHSLTFSSTCGSATLDGKSVTFPACL